jgi:hypothetical protein
MSLFKNMMSLFITTFDFENQNEIEQSVLLELGLRRNSFFWRNVAVQKKWRQKIFSLGKEASLLRIIWLKP